MSSSNITLAHRARLYANRVLNRFGFDLVRCPPSLAVGQDLIEFKLGRYQLHIHRNNSLWREYAKNPEYTAQLGRLASVVFAAGHEGYILDIGANIGDTAAIMRTATDAPIVCVEGDPIVFSLLRQNLASIPQVTAHQHFLGERTEELFVVTDKEGWDSTLVPVDANTGVGGTRVSVLSLDEFAAQLTLQLPCRLLKIDIEGFDLRVLRGGRRLLSSDHPALIFELNHHNLEKLGENSLAFFSYLEELGYRDLCFHDAQGRFLQPCKVDDLTLLCDLLAYAKSVEGIYYYDICAFHGDDSELAARFLKMEREHRQAIVGRVS